MSAQTHASQKLLEVRIREARLRAHAGATNIGPARATQYSRADYAASAFARSFLPPPGPGFPLVFTSWAPPPKRCSR